MALMMSAVLLIIVILEVILITNLNSKGVLEEEQIKVNNQILFAPSLLNLNPYYDNRFYLAATPTTSLVYKESFLNNIIFPVRPPFNQIYNDPGTNRIKGPFSLPWTEPLYNSTEIDTLFYRVTIEGNTLFFTTLHGISYKLICGSDLTVEYNDQLIIVLNTYIFGGNLVRITIGRGYPYIVFSSPTSIGGEFVKRLKNVLGTNLAFNNGVYFFSHIDPKLNIDNLVRLSMVGYPIGTQVMLGGKGVDIIFTLNVYFVGENILFFRPVKPINADEIGTPSFVLEGVKYYAWSGGEWITLLTKSDIQYKDLNFEYFGKLGNTSDIVYYPQRGQNGPGIFVSIEKSIQDLQHLLDVYDHREFTSHTRTLMSLFKAIYNPSVRDVSYPAFVNVDVYSLKPYRKLGSKYLNILKKHIVFSQDKNYLLLLDFLILLESR